MRAADFNQFLQFTLIGIAYGLVFAIAAAGLVLTYTTTGVFNFAHGAVGMVAAFVYWRLTVEVGMPALPAASSSSGVIGPAMGLLLELMFRQLPRRRRRARPSS